MTDFAKMSVDELLKFSLENIFKPRMEETSDYRRFSGILPNTSTFTYNKGFSFYGVTQFFPNEKNSFTNEIWLHFPSVDDAGFGANIYFRNEEAAKKAFEMFEKNWYTGILENVKVGSTKEEFEATMKNLIELCLPGMVDYYFTADMW